MAAPGNPLPDRRVSRRLPGGPRRAGCPSARLGLALGLVILGGSPLQAAGPLRPIPAVVHAHTTWSSGDLTLDGLVARAMAVGVEAIFLTENHLQRFEYGLPPLRNLLRYRVEYPSLMSQGPEPFLDAVRAANARQQDVVLIPGAEVIPHYYWTGNPFRGTLTMVDAQKNILAFGLSRPEDYRDLPVVGNAKAGHWGLGSLWLLSPVALAVPGVWLLFLRRRRLVRLQHVKFSVERRFTGYGVLCLAMGAALLANNFPYRTPPVSPYDSEAGLGPHQAVIDFVAARGGLTAWSMPEARDHQLVTVARMQATIHTDPYPSDLLRTDRFTAFGGVYEDATTFTDPGGGWDRLLADYLAGRRAAPAWAIGEAAYHREGQAGKRFGEVQTVFLAERKDSAALLEALRRGRLYALQRVPEVGLLLDPFQAILRAQPAAEAGDRLILRPGDRPEVRAGIRTTDGRRLPIEVTLVRNGGVVRSVRGETPLTLEWSDPALPAGTGVSYRLEVRGPSPHRLLSNPIFVQAGREGSP